MNGDEMSRGMNQQSRRSNPPNKYNEKPPYSPSSSFGPKQNTNHNYNYNGNYNSSNSSSYRGQPGQNQRRRPAENRSKTGGGGNNSSSNERLAKQNDMIIKLLKEIRDRLPAPPAGTAESESDYLEQDSILSCDTTDQDVDNDCEDCENCDDVESTESHESNDVQEFTSEQEQNSHPAEE